MTNLKFTSNNYNTTLQTTILTKDNTLKLPSTNGTLTTKEELDTALNNIINNINNQTITDPKIPGLETIGNSLYAKDTRLTIHIGKSERAIFKTISDAVKYLARYDIKGASKTFSLNSTAGHDEYFMLIAEVEDGTDFGTGIALSNVDLSWVEIKGPTASDKATVNVTNCNQINFLIHLGSNSFLRFAYLKIVSNGSIGFATLSQRSYLNIIACEFDFTIINKYFPFIVAVLGSIINVINNTITKIKYKNINISTNVTPFSIQKRSFLYYRNSVEVTFENCNIRGFWIFNIASGSYFENQANNGGAYIDVKSIGSTFTSRYNRYICGNHGGRIQCPGIKIKPITVNCLDAVFSLHENSTANLTDIKNLETTVKQNNSNFAFFTVGSGDYLCTKSTTVSPNSKDKNLFNIPANAVNGRGIITNL
ncbi:hypothetical protein ACVWU4_000972 [Campylobacter coli]